MLELVRGRGKKVLVNLGFAEARLDEVASFFLYFICTRTLCRHFKTYQKYLWMTLVNAHKEIPTEAYNYLTNMYAS